MHTTKNNLGDNVLTLDSQNQKSDFANRDLRHATKSIRPLACRKSYTELSISTMAKIKGAIVVDTEKCKGCEVCVVSCPTKVIALATEVNSKGYNYAYMKNPEACTGCASCAMVCPDSVITVYKVKVD